MKKDRSARYLLTEGALLAWILRGLLEHLGWDWPIVVISLALLFWWPWTLKTADQAFRSHETSTDG